MASGKWFMASPPYEGYDSWTVYAQAKDATFVTEILDKEHGHSLSHSTSFGCIHHEPKIVPGGNAINAIGNAFQGLGGGPVL